MSDQPFAGITVVEFGQFIAVPYCAQVLAEGGAHVVKVEPLDGDPTRHLAPLAPGETRHFVSRNRGKHSLPLNLKHPSARRVIDHLLNRADVVLTNLRPGLAADLGLDYGSIATRYPRMIVGNVTAFGHRGPDAGLGGMDIVVQARSGLMAANGRIKDGLPAAGDPPIADYICAMMLAFGIASALFRRERSGRGGEVDVSLLMAALVLQNNLMTRIASVDGPVHADVLSRLSQMREEGAPYAEQAAIIPGARVNYMSSIYYRTFATKDEAIVVACASPGLQRAFMRAIGLVDQNHQTPITDRDELARHYAELQPRVEKVMAAKTTAEWKAILDQHGVPASGVTFPIEMLDDEQVLANGLVRDLEHPVLGPVRVLAAPIGMDGEGFIPQPATAPFGSETRQILAWAGLTENEIEALLEQRATHDGPG